MVFQFTPLHLTLGGIERSNQDHYAPGDDCPHGGITGSYCFYCVRTYVRTYVRMSEFG